MNNKRQQHGDMNVITDILQSNHCEPVLDPFIVWSQSIQWEQIPKSTRTMVKRELLDYIGGAIGGRAVEGIPAWLQVLIDQGGRAEAHVIGGPAIPAQTAALCNGYFGHVLEFDDTHDVATLHAGSACIPAALAAAGRQGRIDGKKLCEAILLGLELTCRLGVANKLPLTEGGWIYGALFGHFGATLAAGHILDAHPDSLKNAFGIAYVLTCGNHQSSREGAPTKHVQPGYAASNGILASLMGGNGLQGVKQPITGEDGLARVYLHNRFEPETAVSKLGQRFELDRLSFKPYPTCRFTHPAISAALCMHAQLGDKADKFDQLEVLVSPLAYDVVGRATKDQTDPQSKMWAQFSMHWCLAVTLVHGELTPRQLVSEVPASARVKLCIERIVCRVDPFEEPRGIGGCRLSASGFFGEIQFHEPHAKGHPDFPLSEDELLTKFVTNVQLGGTSEKESRNLAHQILHLDELSDVSPFLKYLGDLGQNG